MARFKVVLDTCVLVPIVLVDTLLRFAVREFYEPLWSEQILFELEKTLIEIHPNKNPQKLQNRIQVMQTAFPLAVVKGWEQVESGIAETLPDKGDAHVVAAAILGRADAIVTQNLSDFPAEALSIFGLEAISPDVFLLNLFDLNPKQAEKCLQEQSLATRNPKLSVQKILESLEREVPEFCQTVKQRL